MTKKEGLCTVDTMSRSPNYTGTERADLLFKIDKCRRFAKEISDQQTVTSLLALAAEYEQKLNQPSQG